MGKEPDMRVYKAKEVPSAQRPFPRHVIVKLSNINDKKILKAARENKVTFKETPICQSLDFSAETLYVRREWNDIFILLQAKNCHPRMFYPTKLCFRCGEIKSLPDKSRRSSPPADLPYKKCWRGLQAEMKRCWLVTGTHTKCKCTKLRHTWWLELENYIYSVLSTCSIKVKGKEH